MFGEPKFAHSSFVIVFPRKPEIRRLANQFEDVLKDGYGQPTIIGIPDEFEPEIPRLLFSSTHGFSRLEISQISIALNVNFSPDYQVNGELRQTYLASKVPLMFELLKICNIEAPSFIGHSFRIRIESVDATDEQIIQKLTRLLLKNQEYTSLIDLEVKRTEVIEEKYYSNITVSNYREWHEDSSQGVVRRPYESALGRGIQVTSDYNDRYAYNTNVNYFSSQETAIEIIARANQITDVTLRMLSEN